MMNHLIFIGSVQTPEDCAANPWASEAYNVTQLEFMISLHRCGVKKVIAFSLPGTSAFHTRARLHRLKRSTFGAGIDILELPFLALGPLQPLTQIVSLGWHLLRVPRAFRPDAIVIANPLTRYTLPSLIAGRLWRIPIVTVVADLTVPEPGQTLPRRLRQWLQVQMVRLVPGVAVFSAHTARDFRPGKPWFRMARPPGPDLLDLPQPPPNPPARAVYYAGTLAEVAGADLLLDAIPHVSDPDVQFWFSGRGPLENRIRAATERDPRIVLHGFISREEYRDLLQRAAVLVNPRPSRLTENRYNFPSKLMEYLAAGRPVISTTTSDVAEHYREAIVLLEDETPQGLAKAIVSVLALSPEAQAALGAKARAAVEGETWDTQAKRILGLIEELRQ